MEGLSQIRRRRISSINLESPKKKKSKNEDEKDEKAEKKERKLEKKELNPKEWRTEMTPSLKIKIRSPESHKQESSSEDGPPVLTPEVTRPLNPSGENLCPQLEKLELPGTSGTSRLRDEDEDSAFESNGRNEDDLEDDLESEDVKVKINNDICWTLLIHKIMSKILFFKEPSTLFRYPNFNSLHQNSQW